MLSWVWVVDFSLAALFSRPIRFKALFRRPTKSDRVKRYVFNFSLCRRLRYFLSTYRCTMSRNLCEQMISINVFDGRMCLFQARPCFITSFPIFPIVAARCCKEMSCRVSIIFRTISMVFIFSMIVGGE